jgi:hypothetical protein
MQIKGIQFNRQEFSGAFGDIGTDFPLIIAMIVAAGLHTPSVLIVFGIMQIFTGVVYKMPMPVQPLKAMATLVISQKIAGTLLMGAGLAIGLVMLALSLTGILEKLTKFVPKPVIRGIQLGLGITLCLLSFKEYISSDGVMGYLLAFIAFIVILLLLDNKKYPASLIILGLGFVFAFIFKVDFNALYHSVGISFPKMNFPTLDHISKGFVLLALPQIPLSLGNSIMATKQVTKDFFPERKDLTVRKIGITYSIMNLTVPFFSGIPCCHGAGGMVGHYAFGGRTGGSVLIYGIFYILLGVFFGNNFGEIIKVFPLPILGIILLFEGVSLMLLMKDIMEDKRDFVIAALVGVIAFGMPYGFFISMVIGTALYYSSLQLKTLKNLGISSLNTDLDNKK